MSEKARAAIPLAIACCCIGISFGLTLALCLNYSELLGRAEEYDAVAPADTTYDMCGGAYGEGSTETSDWTKMFTLNYYVYLVYACLSGAALVCVPCSPLAACPFCCFNCTNIAAMAAIILSGIRLLGRTGDICAANDAIYNTEAGLSFASDAEMWRKLWITQTVIIIPVSCLMGCGL